MSDVKNKRKPNEPREVFIVSKEEKERLNLAMPWGNRQTMYHTVSISILEAFEKHGQGIGYILADKDKFSVVFSETIKNFVIKEASERKASHDA